MSDVIQLIPNIPSSPAAFDAVKRLSVPQMKAIWDGYYSSGLADRDRGEYILLAVHAEMNERGEGHYVAV